MMKTEMAILTVVSISGVRMAAKPVEVITPGNDPYDLDRDGDGWGCDSWKI